MTKGTFSALGRDALGTTVLVAVSDRNLEVPVAGGGSGHGRCGFFRILLVGLAALASVHLLAVGWTGAETFNANDETSLSAAIDTAKTNADLSDTINIQNDITLTTFLPVLDPGVGGTLTINGNDNRVSAGGVTRIFFANSGTIEIHDVTLSDGLAKGGDGGAGRGGGGGGLGAGGGLFVNDAANVLIQNVTFSGNEARGGNGGDSGSAPGGEEEASGETGETVDM